jgi:tRNA G18 (ribose-2'-O)-methylase SpoU
MRLHPIFLLIHNIRSTHNVGSMFRTADAAGVSQIFLTGYTPTPLDRFGRPVKEIAKVALGAEQTLSWKYYKSPTALLKKMKKEGAYIVGLEQDARSLDYKKIRLDTIRKKQPVIVIVGSEVEGMSAALRAQCDVLAEIPMLGKKESLNVGVSLGIALYRMLNI